MPLGIRVSLGTRAAQGRNIKFRSTECAAFSAQFMVQPSSSCGSAGVGIGDNLQSRRSRSRNPDSYFTVTVIIWHVPATVLCRSSPICSASL